MLITMPAMSDERFTRAVIYVCAHSTEGAMGIIVNQPAQNIKFPDLLVQLEVIPRPSVSSFRTAPGVKVLKGGPVETGRGFVLHWRTLSRIRRCRSMRDLSGFSTSSKPLHGAMALP